MEWNGNARNRPVFFPTNWTVRRRLGNENRPGSLDNCINYNWTRNTTFVEEFQSFRSKIKSRTDIPIFRISRQTFFSSNYPFNSPPSNRIITHSTNPKKKTLHLAQIEPIKPNKALLQARSIGNAYITMGYDRTQSPLIKSNEAPGQRGRFSSAVEHEKKSWVRENREPDNELRRGEMCSLRGGKGAKSVQKPSRRLMNRRRYIFPCASARENTGASSLSLSLSPFVQPSIRDLFAKRGLCFNTL